MKRFILLLSLVSCSAEEAVQKQPEREIEKPCEPLQPVKKPKAHRPENVDKFEDTFLLDLQKLAVEQEEYDHQGLLVKRHPELVKNSKTFQ
jgi:hypothetical protein